ncbi:hypothetical protein, partial [Hyphomicrobium sp.]|uniref:hypothetical protein n=1 Tax=Hyphomicrobium sp. TaxID=82 RepID=UPI002BA6BB2F
GALLIYVLPLSPLRLLDPLDALQSRGQFRRKHLFDDLDVPGGRAKPALNDTSQEILMPPMKFPGGNSTTLD